jgi:hypothetical protein
MMIQVCLAQAMRDPSEDLECLFEELATFFPQPKVCAGRRRGGGRK